jgi:replicative DNA helicase
MTPEILDAEQSVLGAILLDNNAINQALDLLTPEDFEVEGHREIFRAMTALAAEHAPIDPVTLRPKLPTAAGKVIAEAAARVPSARGIATYCAIVRDAAVLRRLRAAGRQIAEAASVAGADARVVAERAEQIIFRATAERRASGFAEPAALAAETLSTVEKLVDHRAEVAGVPTGFADLDRVFGGLQPGWLVVIAARPSMGKTALACSIAANLAIHRDPALGVAFFSLEMSKAELALRIVAAEARVSSAHIRAGYLREDDFKRIGVAASAFGKSPIFIDDSGELTPTQLAARCRRLFAERKIATVIVDYLQLLRPARREDRREAEFAEISRSLKALAKELHVPVIALAQLNRQVEARTNHRPTLADIRESGAIEQDADVIAFIYREEMYDDQSAERGAAEIIVAKNRSGPRATVRLNFDEKLMLFTNAPRLAVVKDEAEQ